jgi:hypothetical protein
MIPESVDSAKGLYAIGSVVLVIGLIAGVVGTLIKRRAEEERRDERYVRQRRGEDVVEAEPPRIASLLQYAGVAIVGLGIVILVAGWTVDPNGQS